MTATTLSKLARAVKIDVKWGASLPLDSQDDWQRSANGYRCTLRYKGRRYTFDFWQGVGISREPDAKGCLSCLLSDSNASEDFEDFCSEFGYDTDSRKAEKTHKACMKVKEHMQRLLGDDYETFLYADNDV